VVLLQWIANPVNDMYADTVLAAVLQAEMLDAAPSFFPIQAKMDRMHFKVCMVPCTAVVISFSLWYCNNPLGSSDDLALNYMVIGEQ
jgi:cleavage and polyadenylation specificity factor subunit 3